MARTSASAPAERSHPPTYAGQRAALATMHGKQDAITPTLLATLGLLVETAPGLDTDALGTFTGETPRAGNMRQAAIAKARLGMAAAGLPLGIASEGSYGPHPMIPFAAGGIELMVLVDDARGIIITEQLIEDAPIYGHAVVAGASELDTFLARHRFPEHGLIVKPNAPTPEAAAIHKGLRDAHALAAAVATAARASADGHALVQTDMRAHMNPSRMQTITRLAEKLAARVNSRCPACDAPGYGQVDVETGLPCGDCGAPTSMVFHHVHGCVACAHRQLCSRPDGNSQADPGYCPHCNP